MENPLPPLPAPPTRGMQDPYRVPEDAIRAFEAATDTSVTVHDLSDQLWEYLPGERFAHRAPQCLVIKGAHQDACNRFDVHRLRAEIQRSPDGLVKSCHGGLVEWVAPVVVDRRSLAILFAGVRSRGPDLRIDLESPDRLPMPGGTVRAPAVDETGSLLRLELLRSLSARLSAWFQKMEHDGLLKEPPGRKSDPFRRSNQALSRGVQIRHYLGAHYQDPKTSLGTLAESLGLSESRAGHAVREACGETYIEMLTEMRLRRATHLLRHTGLPVLEVATQSGFGEVSHFHRAFRKKYRETPRVFRKKSRSETGN